MVLGDEFQAEGMERSDPHFDGGVGIVGGEALAHFLRRLVREGQGQNRSGRGDGRAAILQDVAYAMNQRTRFAGAGAGIDQKRSVVPGSSLKLARIERVWGRR